MFLSRPTAAGKNLYYFTYYPSLHGELRPFYLTCCNLFIMCRRTVFNRTMSVNRQTVKSSLPKTHLTVKLTVNDLSER